MRKLITLVYGISNLVACSITRETPAPVVNVTSPTRALNPTLVTAAPKPVAANQTVVAPAQTTVSKINNDDDQVTVADSKPPTSPVLSKTLATPREETVIGGISWLRPTAGKIARAYTVALKGVDVAAPEGQPIVAAAAATVAYSGNGLKGYGNLIILKHQDNFLTAYSHNKVNLVKEGDKVKQGQKIAEVGTTDSDKSVLHFELRKNGKPLNPSAIFE